MSWEEGGVPVNIPTGGFTLCDWTMAGEGEGAVMSSMVGVGGMMFVGMGCGGVSCSWE